MFSSTIRSALLALTLGAMGVVAAPGLSLKVSGVDNAEGVENLKVTTTLTNTGDETIKLLNDPRTALSKVPTNTFTISSASGKVPAFSGVKVKYVPSVAAAKTDDASLFTVLAAGESVEIEHELASAYNFTDSGADEYEIEASNVFRYVDESNEVKEIYADSETAHSAKLSGKLSVTRRDAGFSKRETFVSGLGKRIGYNSCSSSEQSTLVTAAGSANTYAANTSSYVSGISAATARYTKWFGAYTAARHTTVVSHYSKIDAKDFTGYTYDCTCTDSGTYAYVYPDDDTTIYLCGVFWEVSNTGTDSRAGTLIHESSHFTSTAGTDDHVYGQSGAAALAISNPTNAIDNADNHEYFAENNPALA